MIGLTQHFHGKQLRGVVALLGILFLVPCWISTAQPSLTFKRVTVNWPTLELFIAYGCDGAPRYDAAKQNLRIFENGEEIHDFTFWCPDPAIRCDVSLGMVMDVSGSMRGIAMAAAKQSAHDIAYLCDGVYDEMMLLQAGAKPLVRVPFTSNKVQIHSSIDSCSPGGGSALYDGIYAALQETIARGTNQCRAVIVFTDGGDNGSVRTAQELITLANRNRIRIYTIGYDEYGPKLELELIAQLTGGKFFQDPSDLQMAMIHQEISGSIFLIYKECVVTYDRECADGTQRNVEIQLVDFCGGSDSKTKNYRAPLDSSSFQSFSVDIPRTLLVGLQPGTVPIMFDASPAMLQPFELTVRYDAVLTFLGADVPPGSLLLGIAHEIDQQPGLLTIRSTQALSVNGRAKLLDLEFRAPAVTDSLNAGIAIDAMIVPTGCLLPVITNHPAYIVPRLLPFITASNTAFCLGDSATLEANAGFANYLWSNGETTRSIRIGDGGMYHLSAVDSDGDTLQAEPVMITLIDPPHVSIVADGPLEFCRGKSVRLTCTGDIDGATIRWSDGREGVWQIVSTTGVYWADVTSADGCTARSDTVYTTMTDFTVRALPGRDIQLCPGDSVILSVEGKWGNVKWWGENRETLTVGWKANRSFSLRAEVTDDNGCKGYSDSVHITMLPALIPQVSPSGSLELCTGGTLTLTADSGYAEYHWSTGDRTQSILVNQAGDYSVRVVNHYGCSAWTGTVHVVSVDAPRPRITMMNEPVYCGGDEVVLDGGANYLSWKWNTGATTRTLAVADSGSFWVEVTAHGGCTGISDTVLVRSEQQSDVFLPTVRGSIPLCPGDTLWLDGPAGMADWQWNTGAHGRSLPVTVAGRYAVTVLTPGGCEARSVLIDLSMAFPALPIITRVRDVLSTGTAQAWQWKRNGMPIPGATLQSLTLRNTGTYTVTVVDDNGCTMTSEPFYVNILGISEAVVPDDLLLYPEPASDWLQIVFPEHSRDARVTLVSLLGQVLVRQEAHGDSDARTMRIDLSALPSGVYLLQASAGEKRWVRKVVVRR